MVSRVVGNPTDVGGWTIPLAVTTAGVQHFHGTRRQVEPSSVSIPAGLAVDFRGQDLIRSFR